MDVLKIVPASSEKWLQFIPYLKEEYLALEEELFRYQFIPLNQGAYVLQCIQYPEHVPASQVIHTFKHYLSAAVAEYVVEEREKDLIMQLIIDRYGFQNEEEINKIYQASYQLLNYEEEENRLDEHKIMDRKSTIFKKTLDCLTEERPFHLEGFIRFRMKEYYQNLEEVVTYAIEEFIVDREYQDFLQLIKSYISIQETKVPLLHVFHYKDRQFLLYDQELEHISEAEIEDYLSQFDSSPSSYEDVIVSTLIAIAPKRIILHTKEPSLTVIQTLKNIFHKQLVICSDCPSCSQWAKNIHPSMVRD